VEKLISEFDLALYSRGIRYVASLSRLFSTSETPLVDSRFAEKLFCASTGADDLSRSDMSFDAVYDLDAGVGVKTFIATGPNSSKFEKVAEFTKLAPSLGGLSAIQLAIEVSRLRNLRVMSDASQLGIDLGRSFYHCLVRIPGKMFVHEEPYELIELSKVQLINANPSTITFTDGKAQYRFSLSKTVLFKRFELVTGANSKVIDTPVNDLIWKDVLGGNAGKLAEPIASPVELDLVSTRTSFVVLPLYTSSKAKGSYIAPRSGINQWNARGRKRKFGEAYIPVPMVVHKVAPNFFPSRDSKFRLKLPNGQIVSAKLCQANSKALMSDPNELICKWLFSAIDGTFAAAASRFDAGDHYVYSDLESIDRDSVLIRKVENEVWDFELELARLGSFESFITGELEPE